MRPWLIMIEAGESLEQGATCREPDGPKITPTSERAEGEVDAGEHRGRRSPAAFSNVLLRDIDLQAARGRRRDQPGRRTAAPMRIR